MRHITLLTTIPDPRETLTISNGTTTKIAPQFGHIPLAVTESGYKLSKQNKAPALNLTHPQPTLFAALRFLGQVPPQNLMHCSVNEIITWAIKNMQFSQLPQQQEILL